MPEEAASQRVIEIDTKVRVAASRYLGWRYPQTRASRVYVERASALVQLPVARHENERVINCSTFTVSLLGEIYPDGWDAQSYGDLQVYADRVPARLGAPVEALIRAGHGVSVKHPTLHAWHLVQGWWGREPYRGHALLVRPLPSGALEILESSSSGLIGPRFRLGTWDGLKAKHPVALYVGRLA